MKFSIRRTLFITLLFLSSESVVLADGAPNCDCERLLNDPLDPDYCDGDITCDAYQDCLDFCTGIPVDGNVWALVAAGVVLGLSSISRARLKKSLGTFVNKTFQ